MQNHFSKPEYLMLQSATPLRKSAPWLPNGPNVSDEHVSCTAPAARNTSLHILLKCPTSAIVFGHATKALTFCSLLTRCTNPCACHAKPHLNLQKWWGGCGVCNMLTLKRASRHDSVHLFNISTSKSGPELVCFAHFDLETCFAPQRRAHFQHLNFQKWSEPFSFFTCLTSKRGLRSEPVSFWHFWLPNVRGASSRNNGLHFLNILTSKNAPNPSVFLHVWLRSVLFAPNPSTACTFSTSCLPKMLRTCQFLTLLTSQCASRQNGVKFFISRLARWLRTRRFSDPTFRASGGTNHRKKQKSFLRLS